MSPTASLTMWPIQAAQISCPQPSIFSQQGGLCRRRGGGSFVIPRWLSKGIPSGSYGFGMISWKAFRTIKTISIHDSSAHALYLAQGTELT